MEFFVDGGLQKLLYDLNNQQQCDFNEDFGIPAVKNTRTDCTTQFEEIKEFYIYTDPTMENEETSPFQNFEQLLYLNEITNTTMDHFNNTLNHSFDSHLNLISESEKIIGSNCCPEFQINQINSTNGGTTLHDITFSLNKNLNDWEESFLENFVDISELADSLPDRTPLCTNTCDYFLEESSLNLKYKLSPDPTIDLTSTNFMNKDVSLQNSDNNYLCHYSNCGKVYRKSAHLKAHLRRHVGEKPYVCNWPSCTWKFSRSDELSRHNRSHSGIKPYKCVYCDKCFARSDHLTKHRKVHERRLLAVTKMGKIILNGNLPPSILNVRPGRKKKI